LSIIIKLSLSVVIKVSLSIITRLSLSIVIKLSLCTGAKYTFTIKEGADGKNGRISVNYDGLLSLKILEKTKQDVVCEVVDGGVMGSRYAPH